MAQARITFRGKRLNERTRDMLIAAEQITGHRYVVTQGCYNAGSVAASAGTHDGGGVIDLRAVDLSKAERDACVLALRRVGFAAWLRSPAEGDWPAHIHAVAVGDRDLSPSAFRQVQAYQRGRNGLVSNRADTGPDGFRAQTFEKYKASIRMPRHPLYVSTIRKAQDIEHGDRKDALDPWEQGHVDKVLATMRSVVVKKGTEPHQALSSVINQFQHAAGLRDTGGRFTDETVAALEALAGYRRYNGIRHANGVG